MRRRRLTPAYQITIAAVFLWLLAIAGISTANAAQLNVLALGQLSVFNSSKCDDAVDVEPQGRKGNSNVYDEVEISGIASACDGLTLTFYLLDAGGAVVETGSGTASTGTVTFGTSNYNASNVDSAAVLIATWPIPTTWTAP